MAAFLRNTGKIVLLFAILTLTACSAQDKARCAAFKADPINTAANAAGSTTLVEFFQYGDKAARFNQRVIDQTTLQFRQVRVVMRCLPGESKDSKQACLAANGAKPLGRFLALHQGLIYNELPLTDNRLSQLAEQADLNPLSLLTSLTAPDTAQRVQNNVTLAKQLGIKSTPVILIGPTDSCHSSPTVLKGQITVRELQKALKQ